MKRRVDPSQHARKARRSDLDDRVYARRRRAAEHQRAQKDRAAFDPEPPTDDDWVVPDTETDGLHRIGAPTAIGESLQRFVERQGWAERLRGADAWSRWDQIVGAELASRCEPVRLAGKILVIRAESQVWATQLRYLIAQLRTNFDRELGVGAVTQIRIEVGPLTGRKSPEQG